jgi:ketosteroid isomerase-like protein
LRHAVLSGWEALARRDFEVMLVRYAPDVVYEADARFQSLGIPASARGRGEMAHVLEEIIDVWDRLVLAPTAIVDLGGESVIGLGTNRGRGQRSGIEIEGEFAQLLTTKRGLVVHERDFSWWDDALRAAGLDPAALDMPARR